jgi:large subunit ribosomal protein L6
VSRVGKAPVAVPAGVTCEISGREVKVAGPKGKLSITVPEGVKVLKDGAMVRVEIDRSLRLKERDFGARHGLARALIAGMVKGVAQGYERKLEMMGAGFRPTVKGNQLSLTLGFSHPVAFDLPQGVKATAEKVETGGRSEERHVIVLTGCNAGELGELAAKIRKVKTADVYKGKGVKYAGEVIKKKPGKAAATTAGTGGK